MLAVAVIVFREVVEAALIVGVVLAASRGVSGRAWWVNAGIAVGVLGALVVAGFAGEIASALDGVGQEIFNAAILFAAVIMLGLHNVWMRRQGRELAQSASSVGAEVRAGTRPLAALATVAGLAVLREGSEVVLFVYGVAAAQGTGAAGVALGALIGVAGGVAVGAAIYYGLVTIPMRHLFTVTSAVILLLAAGMASQGAAFLVQADLLPPLGGQVWDTSSLLTERSLLGQTLHALIGYVARPEGIQVVAYVATLVVIGGMMRGFGRRGVIPARAR
ncbi:MAG TPA: FTR1 family protein [Stellaceae bacterium]|nr:FTR1 family protein [Stellaceae bacterium]